MTEPFAGVPPEARTGLDEVLARAITVDRARLVDDNSGEAVTWTIFSHLLQHAEAQPCWKVLAGESGWPSALIWGGEALGEQAEYVRERLIDRSHGWAPDVVLEFWPQSLVMVVARYYKPNLDVRQGWGGWLDETDAFGDPSATQASGRFDLARAWRLGWELAGPRNFTLVNLLQMPERAQQQAATDLFRSSLKEREDRHFKQLSWRALLAPLPSPWPEWLTRYAKARRLI